MSTSDIPSAWGSRTLLLHPVSMPLLKALSSANLSEARPLLSPFTAPSSHIISPSCVRTWNRRYQQLQVSPDDAAWVTRLVVLRGTDEVIGRAGFHARPDPTGMAEIGYEIDPLFRRKGYGAEAITIMLEAARYDPSVKVVRASVGFENTVSRGMVLRAGFEKVGQEMDEEDGMEEIYELRL